MGGRGRAGEDLRIAPMGSRDLPAVRALELAALPHPWPEAAMRHEVEENPLAHYFTARAGQRLIGYAGLWLQHDELHVSMIAVDPAWRGRGIGRALLIRLLEEGMALGCRCATLEVRETNRAAQRLYARLGFEPVGRRRRYYADTGEDGLILTTPDFDDPSWRRDFEAWRGQAPTSVEALSTGQQQREGQGQQGQPGAQPDVAAGGEAIDPDLTA